MEKKIEIFTDVKSNEALPIVQNIIEEKKATEIAQLKSDSTLPIVQNNFEIVIFGIIGLSLLPMLIEFIRAKMKSKKK